MNKKKREEEAEILRKMFSDTDGEPNSDAPPKESVKKTAKNSQSDDDVIRCPRCGYVLPSRSSCPRCAYNGYVPMTKAETKKVKLILYPIVLIIVVLVILWQKGIIG